MRRGALRVWLAAMAIYIVAMAGRTSLGVVGLEAMARFHMSASVLSLFTVVQLGVYALAQIPVGIALDRWGTRRVMVVGGLAMAVGQVGLAFATSVPAALAVRALIGMGDATAFTAVLRIIPAWFAPLQVPVMTQLTSIIGQLGQVISSVPFAAVVAGLGWTTGFTSLAALGALVAVVGLALIRNTPANFSHGAEKDRKRLASVTNAVEVNSAAPGVWETLKNPGALLGFWVHFATCFPSMSFLLLWGVPFFQVHDAMPKAAASAMLIFNTVFGIVLGPIVGRLVAAHPLRRSWIIYVTSAITTVAFAVVIVGPSPSPFLLSVALLVTTALSGVASNVAFDFARTSVHPRRLGTANGLINMGGFVSGLTAALIIGVTLDVTSPAGQYTPGSFSLAMAAQFVLLASLGAVEYYKRKVRAQREAAGGPKVPPLADVFHRYQERWDRRRRRHLAGKARVERRKLRRLTQMASRRHRR
ncbi:MFS family permease [Arcanobacterium wilhelmae]|uniref:Lysosomal dipeptide transporter MFSD1 n=1 Tax=Arcanobacterium wilhelmae TaxID=1803177 RepID=A0ABT9N976_9ACTO|nr:MFS transporter [Arcanobacterium wilhelmae]MDP9800262.1 MFS family permease [Arcanobacterium wilhelmae]WFN89701.1 MFS transporter [Arcanobacterium wilhelmae]